MKRTRSQLRAANRARRDHASRNPGRFLPALEVMVENPNRGKRGAARLDILGERASRAIADARQDYRPLTITTPITHDRIGRKLPVARRSESSYTI